jgi:multidrug resistance efflux pump
VDVERKRSDELAKRSEWELAESQVERCREQIASCTIHTQADGAIVLADDPHPEPDGHCLKEGTKVDAWHEILSVFDVDGEIRVTTTVPESMIEWVKTGLQARITFDGFPEVTLPGVVAEVAPLPNPSYGGILISEYATRVKIERGFPGIRRGMGAKVEIFLDGLDD